MAHKPNSKPKEEYVVQLEEEEEEEEIVEEGNGKRALTEEELWARLDELERLEEEQDGRDRLDKNHPPCPFVCCVQKKMTKTLIGFTIIKGRCMS